MLFNSYIFIFCFLPVSLAGYAVTTRFPTIASVIWLAACSLVFYAYWYPPLVLLILTSIAFNFFMGEQIAGRSAGPARTWFFRIAVAVNLLALCSFKYLGPLYNFFIDHHFIDARPVSIMLPLGISFFTLTQIGYLVDRRDEVGERLGFLRYTLFVTFFPHLIAGPIIHIREIGKQLKDPDTFKMTTARLAPGLTLFVIGLAKKVLLADPLARVVKFGFDHPDQLSASSAWIVIVGYSVQLYFDFSGYSDMAIGLAGMFGFKFPINFNSPFKSRNIIEFWQRWHMTLSRYLTLLLYNPVAMAITRRRVAQGKKMSAKALANPAAFGTMIVVPTVYTMGLAGLWHGAGLQYLCFGLLHAVYLCVNHAIRLFQKTRSRNPDPAKDGPFQIIWKIGATYLAAMVSFVFFRSSSVSNAVQVLSSALGAHGLGFGGRASAFAHHHLGMPIAAPDPAGLDMLANFALIAPCLILIWLLPNSQEIMGRYAPVIEAHLEGKFVKWRPNLASAFAIAVVFGLCLLRFNRSTTFLYYQF